MASSPPAQQAGESRFFHDPANSPYILPADAEEGRRQTVQHGVITLSAGGKLVVAPVQLADGDKVLDCATGTGVWLMDLASKTSENVLFEGIDISPHQFPALNTLPPNVSFHQHSALSLPESFSSEYTLVNQRLLSPSLRTGDWPLVLQTHLRVLRPGGWLQICEIHLPGFSPPSPCTARVQGILNVLLKKRGLDVDGVLHIAEWARAAGFVNVQTMCTHAPVGAGAGDGPHNYTTPMLAFFRTMRGVLMKEGILKTEEEYDQAVREMENEWDNLDNPSYPFYWVWGQKPLGETDRRLIY